MTGKKIGRRELLKLLPGGILAALAALAVGDAVEAAEFKGWHLGDPCVFCGIAHDDVEIGPCHDCKRANLQEVMKTESPVRAASDAGEMGSGTIADAVDYGSLTWIYGEEAACPDCGMVGPVR